MRQEGTNRYKKSNLCQNSDPSREVHNVDLKPKKPRVSIQLNFMFVSLNI